MARAGEFQRYASSPSVVASGTSAPHRPPQLRRVALLVKENKPLDVIGVSLFGSKTEVPETRDIAHLIEQFRL